MTTYENSRACKPNLLYYEQILESIGHRAEACLVVGDEDGDMVAAHLGCATFLVCPELVLSRVEGLSRRVPGPAIRHSLEPVEGLDPATPEPTYCGTLADLEMLLQSWSC